jgi:WD40 repeat protein
VTDSLSHPDLKETFLLLSLFLIGLPQTSLQTTLSASCNQTWTLQVPSAEEASLAITADGSSASLGELVPSATLPGNPNNLIHFSFQQGPLWFASQGAWPPSSFLVRMSLDGEYVASSRPGGGVQVFGGYYGDQVWQFPSPLASPYVAGYDLSRDGKYLAVIALGSGNNTLYVFQIQNGKKAWSYTFPGSVGNTTSMHPISLSTDGSRIAALMGRTLFMFSNTNNQTLWTKVVKSSSTLPFLSGDGNYLATFEDANMSLYSGSSGQVTYTSTLPGGLGSSFVLPEDAFSLSGDGSTLAMLVGRPWQLVVQDRATGRTLYTKNDLGQAMYYSTPYTIYPSSVSLSHDGGRVAVGSQDGRVFVFDRAGNEVCEADVSQGNLGGDTLVKSSDDGNSIVAFTLEGRISLVTLSPNYELVLGGVVSIAAGVLLITFFALREKERHDKKSRTEKSRKWLDALEKIAKSG